MKPIPCSPAAAAATTEDLEQPDRRDDGDRRGDPTPGVDALGRVRSAYQQQRLDEVDAAIARRRRVSTLNASIAPRKRRAVRP